MVGVSLGGVKFAPGVCAMHRRALVAVDNLERLGIDCDPFPLTPPRKRFP